MFSAESIVGSEVEDAAGLYVHATALRRTRNRVRITKCHPAGRVIDVTTAEPALLENSIAAK
jgi:hypothetical protein